MIYLRGKGVMQIDQTMITYDKLEDLRVAQGQLLVRSRNFSSFFGFFYNYSFLPYGSRSRLVILTPLPARSSVSYQYLPT